MMQPHAGQPQQGNVQPPNAVVESSAWTTVCATLPVGAASIATGPTSGITVAQAVLPFVRPGLNLYPQSRSWTSLGSGSMG